MKFKVIGAGLAGVEAAWQIAEAGFPVELYEMKGIKRSPVIQVLNAASLLIEPMTDITQSIATTRMTMGRTLSA